MIHRIRRQYPNAILIVTGCYAQLKPTEISHIEGVDFVLGQEEKPLIEKIYGEGFTPEQLSRFYQSEKKRGGYVRFKAFPKGTKEDLALDMFDQMEQLLAQGTRPSDMMVLVREKKEAAFITDLHASLTSNPLTSNPLTYKHVPSVHFVSSDSFLLEASEGVRTIIAALKAIVNDDIVAAKSVELAVGKTDILDTIKQTITRKTPLYEAVCELIKILLTDAEGRYQGTETAYINSFLDRTRDYVSSYGSHTADFLTYWEDTLRTKPIPASATDAIRILTVHASKGLQAQTLFVPFCTWTKEAGRHPQKIWCEVADEVSEQRNDFVPIQDGPEMADSAYRQAYEEEHRNMRVDNLNMLYVALTRAEDNLFVSTSYPVTAKGTMGACNHVGKYIMDFLETDDYEVGTPVIQNHTPLTTNPLTTNPFSFSGTPTETAELWANGVYPRT